MRDEMKKRLYDVLCVAPWTELDLNGEWHERTKQIRKKGINGIMVQNRQKRSGRRSKNDK